MPHAENLKLSQFIMFDGISLCDFVLVCSSSFFRVPLLFREKKAYCRVCGAGLVCWRQSCEFSSPLRGIKYPPSYGYIAFSFLHPP